MDENDFSDTDFVIIGNNFSSYLLAILLAKKYNKILLVSEKSANNQTSDDRFSLVPLDFLRLHSIPYNELSFKKKTPDSYIERYIRYEKFFISNKSSNSDRDWYYYKYRQTGIVNLTLFLTYIKKLSKNESKIIFRTFENTIGLEISPSKKKDSQYSISISGIQTTLPSKKLILSDSMSAKYLNNLPNRNLKPVFRYTFKTNDILADSVNHYYSNLLYKVSIIPCNKFTIIEFFSLEDLTDPFQDFFLTFLERKFDLYKEDLELINRDVNYRTIDLTNNYSFSLLPQTMLFSFPVISDLYLKLESIFTLSLSLDNADNKEYIEWLTTRINDLNMLYTYLFDSNNTNNLQIFAKMVKGKDINNINIISKKVLDFKFKKNIKDETIKEKGFEYYLQIVRNS